MWFHPDNPEENAIFAAAGRRSCHICRWAEIMPCLLLGGDHATSAAGRRSCHICCWAEIMAHLLLGRDHAISAACCRSCHICCLLQIMPHLVLGRNPTGIPHPRLGGSVRAEVRGVLVGRNGLIIPKGFRKPIPVRRTDTASCFQVALQSSWTYMVKGRDSTSHPKQEEK